jgi:hypothetical protein
MDDDRKYKQRGYQDSPREYSSNGGMRDERPRPPQGPRPPIDVTGPRLPRLVQATTAVRCYNCSTTLPAEADWVETCPKCHVALHCCKQCAHFEPSTRFQCLKPVPARISPKDAANTCELFKPRMTVVRDAAPGPSSGYGNGYGNGNGNGNGNGAGFNPNPPAPRSANDARAQFDNLFKKPE